MGNIPRQIVRPITYAATAIGSGGLDVQTYETGRYNTGGHVVSFLTNNKLVATDSINLNDFDIHLQNKGLPSGAINYFGTLKYVQEGNRQLREFQLNRQNAKVQKIGVAVSRKNQNLMDIAIVWDEFRVNFAPPKTVVNFEKRKTGIGYRDTTSFSNQVDRGLNSQELRKLRQRLDNEANKESSGIRAQNILKSMKG